MYDRIKAVERAPGRASIDPKILVALWLFATLEGIGSARQLDQPCRTHDGFRGIAGDVSTHYHTLSDFRTRHVELLDKLLTDNVAVLIAEGLVDLNRVAQDGMLGRASAGAASFRRRPTLEEAYAEAQAQAEALRDELDEDPGAENRRQKKARERAVRERAQRIKEALERLPELEARKKPEGLGKARCSTTDPTATVMKMADGGFRPAYNFQFSTATNSQVIVGVDLGTTGSDARQALPMVEQVEGRYKTTPGEVLIDGGFAQHDQIEALEAPEKGCMVCACACAKGSESGPVCCQAFGQSSGGGMAGADGDRGGQDDLQGASRNRRVRHRPGAKSRLVPTASTRPAEGQGGGVVVCFGS